MATKKVETPFLIRRVEVLKKLQANKDWLEENFKIVRDTEAQAAIEVDRNAADEWVTENFDAVVRHIKDGNYIVNNHWNQNFAQTGAYTIVIDLHEVPGNPFSGALKKGEAQQQLRMLSQAVKGAFQSSTTSQGKVIPSRYQQITQYIALLEQASDEFIDAKFYDGITSILPSFKEQYELSNTID